MVQKKITPKRSRQHLIPFHALRKQLNCENKIQTSQVIQFKRSIKSKKKSTRVLICDIKFSRKSASVAHKGAIRSRYSADISLVTVRIYISCQKDAIHICTHIVYRGPCAHEL